MTVTETLIRKIMDLPEERRLKILTYVEQLEWELSGKQQRPIDPYGLCADIHQDIGIQGNHGSVAPLAIASSKSSSVTPRMRGLRIPHNDSKSTFSTYMSTIPSSRRRKLIRSPV